MQPTHFRAYALDTVVSRRNVPTDDGAEQRMTVNHDVHNPAVEGEVKDGIAAFSSGVEIAYVAFYAGDEQVCVGHVDGPFPPGEISVDFADIPGPETVDLGNGEYEINGTVYRKAD